MLIKEPFIWMLYILYMKLRKNHYKYHCRNWQNQFIKFEYCVIFIINRIYIDKGLLLSSFAGGIDLNKIALTISIILFIIGIIGTIVPALPGSILVFGGMILYGFMTQFKSLNLFFYLLEALALLLTFIVDFIATSASTKRFGGSKKAQWGAIIGTIFGILVFGPLGILFGPFIGAIVAELIQGIDIKQAIYSGFGSVVGAIGATFLKLIIEALMIIYFFIVI